MRNSSPLIPRKTASPVRAVAFDAVGTLIEPWPTVAGAYRLAAAEQGVELAEELIKSRFSRAFAHDDEASAFRTDEAAERTRWRRIVADCLPELTLRQADAAFDRLWAHFESPANWRLFPDVVAVVSDLAGAGFELCIASNFDSRLRAVWAGLVDDGFPLTNLVISSEIGVRKPGESFYDAVVASLDHKPREILFVGDDLVNDFQVPRRKGFEVALIDRHGRFGDVPGIARLTELYSILGVDR